MAIEDKIRYEDLLSGDSIFVSGVGHVHSPKLKEMKPTKGIGWERYNYYVFFMKMDEAQIDQFPTIKRSPGESLFQCILNNEPLRELYSEAFSFFLDEYAVYEERISGFVVVQKEKDSESLKLVGTIVEDNFDHVRATILTLNYIPLSETNLQTKHSSEASEILWELAQQMVETKAKAPADEKLTIGNILSKLCVIHPSLNYLNVFELTVFQFYDTFFQCCYIRQTEFSEAIVSNHGSKDFKYENWLNPVENR